MVQEGGQWKLVSTTTAPAAVGLANVASNSFDFPNCTVTEVSITNTVPIELCNSPVLHINQLLLTLLNQWTYGMHQPPVSTRLWQ